MNSGPLDGGGVIGDPIASGAEGGTLLALAGTGIGTATGAGGAAGTTSTSRNFRVATGERLVALRART